MTIVTLCGSLRARSSNRAILRAYAQLAPAGLSFRPYEGLGRLPHFNPDLDHSDVPAEVLALRQAVALADVLVISTPEYAHALPGSFKNALDWLVSDPAMVGKPVVILHAIRGSSWALDSLKEVLRTMSAEILEDASVTLPLIASNLGEEAIFAREDVCALLAGSIHHLTERSPSAGAP